MMSETSVASTLGLAFYQKTTGKQRDNSVPEFGMNFKVIPET
jgi:hypothetical protein